MSKEKKKKLNSKTHDSATKTKIFIELILWLLTISALALAIASYVKGDDQVVYSGDLPEGLQLKNGILHAKGFSDKVDCDQHREANLDYTHFFTQSGIVTTKTLKSNEINSNTLKVSALETNHFTLTDTDVQKDSLLKSVDDTGEAYWGTNTSDDAFYNSDATGDNVTKVLNSLIKTRDELLKWSSNYSPYNLQYSQPNTPFTTYPDKISFIAPCYSGTSITIPWGQSCRTYDGGSSGIMAWFYITPGYKTQPNILWKFFSQFLEGTSLSLATDLKTFTMKLLSTETTLSLEQSFKQNTWHHIAWNCPYFNDGPAILYVDGNSIGQVTPLQSTLQNVEQNTLTFTIPADSKIQDLRIFNTNLNNVVEILTSLDVTNAYNLGLGTFEPSLSPYFVGHFYLNEGSGTTISNTNQVSIILPERFIGVEDSWDPVGNVVEIDYNYLRAPQINFPPVLTAGNEIHTYFSVLLPVYLSGLDINLTIGTFKNILSIPATNETNWELGWSVIQDGEVIKDLTVTPFTIPAVDKINIMNITNIKILTLPTITKATQLSGRLSRVFSNDTSPTVLSVFDFEN